MDNLEALLNHGMISITSLINDFEKLIYGDSSDIIITLVNSLITHYHAEFKSQTNK